MIHKYLLPLILTICVTLYCPDNKAAAQKPDTKVTLGIKPDYWYTTHGSGMKVSDVLPGQTAQLAGIKAGDIIKALDGKTIKDIFAYKDALGKYAPGDSVIISVSRNEQQLIFRTKFSK